MLTTIQRISLAGFGVLAASKSGVAEGGQAKWTDDAMFVFEWSGSMAAISHNGLKSPHIDEERQAIDVSMPQFSLFRDLGRVIFNPGPADFCCNIDLRFTPQSNAWPRIIADVHSLALSARPLRQTLRNSS